MTKFLIIWNIIVTLLLAGSFFSGCSSIDPEFASLSAQVKSNRAALEQLADAVNQDRTQIASNTQAVITLKAYVETVVSQIQSAAR